MATGELSSSNPAVLAATGGSMLAGAGVLGKAWKDLGRIETGGLDWLRNLQQMTLTGDPLVDTRALSRSYSHGGKDLLRAKILGMPIPYWTTRGLPVGETLLEAGGDLKQRFLKRLGDKNARPSSRPWQDLKSYLRYAMGGGGVLPQEGRHEHYRKFRHKSVDDITNYIATHSAPNGLSNRSLDILRMPNTANARTALSALATTDPDQHRLLLQHMQDKTRYLAGHGGAGGGGIAQKYVNESLDGLRVARRALARGAGILGGVGAATTAVAGVNALRDHRQKSDLMANLFKSGSVFNDGEVGAPDAAAAGLGAALAGRGVYNWRRPMDIATTWSEATESHGAGHMMPGRSLRGILEDIQKQPGAPKMRLFDAKLNQHGAVDPSVYGRRYDMLFDTGMGWVVPREHRNYLDPNMQWEQARLMKDPLPRVRAGGYVGYMTDLGTLGAPAGHQWSLQSPARRLAQTLGIKDNYIGWGPTNEFNTVFRRENSGRFRGHNVAPGGYPLLTPTALSALEQAQQDPSGFLARVQQHAGISPDQKQRIAETFKKPTISVLGSSRGDYTSLRALELAEALERRGLSDKVNIMTILGELGQKNPISDRLAKHKNILAFQGKLPQDLYVGLPALSSLIDASTGTSSLYESLGSNRPVALRSEWNPIKAKEMQWLSSDPSLWSGKSDNAKRDLLAQLSGVDLDTWNRGNRHESFKMPGVFPAGSSDEVIDRLLELKDKEFSSRGGEVLRGSQFGRGEIRNRMTALIRRSNTLKRLFAGAQMGVGGGLMALPALDAFRTAKSISDGPQLLSDRLFRSPN